MALNAASVRFRSKQGAQLFRHQPQPHGNGRQIQSPSHKNTAPGRMGRADAVGADFSVVKTGAAYLLPISSRGRGSKSGMAEKTGESSFRE